MNDHIDPQATGTWDITTLSGAQYRLRVPPDARATVLRIPHHELSAQPGGPPPSLRRDHEPIEIVTWGSFDQLLGPLPGIAVGQCMLLVLEPLGATGNATVRLTTPVVGIFEADEPSALAAQS